MHGGSGLLAHYRGSLLAALRAVYPHEHWNTHQFMRPGGSKRGRSVFSKNQYMLFQQLQSVSDLPDE